MKIDRIEIENLASLRGEQPEILLDGGALADAGLIAITGATGAGKTTILDAVCLALYDRTPRLDSASEAQELLSRGAGEGRTRVDLTLDDDRRWTVEWSVHRARQRPDGALQPSRRRILDRTTGEVVADGKRDVAERVERALGLTFDQFTGVILLAQGEFAKFLSSTDADRSALLERLTGTEIYSELGKAAFERHKALRGRLEIESERLDRLVLLDAGDRRRLEQELDDLEPTLARLEAQLRGVEDQLQWLATRARLDAREAESTQRLTRAESRWTAATDERRRLDDAEQATSLAAPLQAVDTARASLERANREHLRAERDAERSAAAHGRALIAVAAALSALRHAADEVEREIDAVGTFATISADDLADLRQARRELGAAEQEIDRSRVAVSETTAALSAQTAERDAAADALTAAAEQHRALTERLDELDERRRRATRGEAIPRLAERRLLLDRAIEVCTALDAVDLEQATETVEARRVELRGITAEADASRSLVETARRDLDDHDAVLRLAVLGADYAEHRHDLVPGEPCPLCGALDHPLADLDGEPPADDRSALRRAEARRDVLRRELDQAETGLDEADRRRRRAEQEVERAEDHSAHTRRIAQEQEAHWIELSFQLPDLPRHVGEASSDVLDRLRHEAVERLRTAEALDAEETTLRREIETAAEASTGARQRHGLAAERLDQAHRRADEARGVETEAVATLDARRRAVLDRAAALAEAAGLDAPSIDTLDAFGRHLVDGRTRHLDAVERRRHLDSLDGRYGERARGYLAGAEHPPTDDEPSLDRRSLDDRLRDVVGDADRSQDAAWRDRQHVAYTAEASAAAEQHRLAAEAELAAALGHSPFADEATARAAWLAPEAIDTLRRHLETLRLDVERRRAEHDRSIADLDEHRGRAEALGLDPDEAPEPLEQSLSASAHTLRTRTGEAQDRKTTLRVQIEQDDARQRERQELETAVGDLHEERRRAARLADLIGQSDGGKFRRYAQQLNLDQL
ncbi:MAG: AAA family ATPase, partial [Acidobacteriota bacterium]